MKNISKKVLFIAAGMCLQSLYGMENQNNITTISSSICSAIAQGKIEKLQLLFQNKTITESLLNEIIDFTNDHGSEESKQAIIDILKNIKITQPSEEIVVENNELNDTEYTIFEFDENDKDFNGIKEN